VCSQNSIVVVRVNQKNAVQRSTNTDDDTHHGQAGQGIFENLLKAKEFEHTFIDSGMESQASLVRTEDTVKKVQRSFMSDHKDGLDHLHLMIMEEKRKMYLLNSTRYDPHSTHMFP